jgi:hypothetical protein
MFRRNTTASRALLVTCFWLGLFFDLQDGGDVPPKRRLTSTGLHGATSQKTELSKKVFLEINLALNPSTGILISTSRN